MNIKHINKFQKPMIVILLFSILFVFSCSSDNSITSTQENLVGKTTSVFDNGDDPEPEDWLANQIKNQTLLGYIFLILGEQLGGYEGVKAMGEKDANAACVFGWINSTLNSPNCNIENQQGYNFRDNYLTKSEKGELYTACYYLLSHYAIENNLLMKHPLEHISIMETGIEVSKELQHGTNNNKILIDKSTYENLNELSKIYRNSENNLDIDIAPILDYLEADLEKYYNKPKAEIAADFGF